MNSGGRARWIWLLQSALLSNCLLLLGCGPNATHEPAANPAARTSVAFGDASTTPIDLQPVDRAAYDAAIAKLRGKVVLVDFWATWCLPCVEQLPHTLELGRQLRDRGLEVVTVSCDESAESERVAAFLASKHAGIATNLISQFGGSPQTMEAFDISSGAVPFYKLYDRNGKLRQTFGIDPAAKKQFTPADVKAAAKTLLDE